MTIICKKCSSNNYVKAGLKKLKNNKLQRYKCNDCKSFFTGYEKFNRLSDTDKLEIIDDFKKYKKLIDIAKAKNVNLRAIQYVIKKNLTIENYEKIKLERKRYFNSKRSFKERYRIRKYYERKNTIHK
ncbi:hypothetical protein [Aliarcobacter cryaerophilus]|uniref:hypothetical protein n=1 Tax=Aliarcobacter cryaerophilus TaxID=28198 RepID=UPI003DA4E556